MTCSYENGKELREFQYWPIEDLTMRPKPNKSATKLEFKPQQAANKIIVNH